MEIYFAEFWRNYDTTLQTSNSNLQGWSPHHHGIQLNAQVTTTNSAIVNLTLPAISGSAPALRSD